MTDQLAARIEGLVARLRTEYQRNGGQGAYAWNSRELCGIAADTIEALAAERDRQYDENVAQIARYAALETELAKVLPIRVQDGPDYAEIFFGEGTTYAMTIHPQDWINLASQLKGV